jgi:preprotein translocase subunit SecE
MTDTRGTTAIPERDRPVRRGARRPRGPFARIGLFVRQVVAELRKVVWPTRNQLLTYTAVVLVFVSLMIAIVSVLDLVFGWAVLKIFG